MSSLVLTHTNCEHYHSCTARTALHSRVIGMAVSQRAQKYTPEGMELNSREYYKFRGRNGPKARSRCKFSNKGNSKCLLHRELHLLLWYVSICGPTARNRISLAHSNFWNDRKAATSYSRLSSCSAVNCGGCSHILAKFLSPHILWFQ